MKMKFVWSLLVTVACIFGATNLAAKAGAADGGAYTTKDKEFYLTPEELLFIRPGVELEILDVVIPADMKLEVTYSITDPSGMPLDTDGVNTPGPIDVRYILAHIPMGEEQKVRLAYLRASRPANGTVTKLSPGVYNFKFADAIDFDMDTTHNLGLTASRDLRDYDLDRYASNDYQNWVPSGMYDAVPRDIVTTATCNRCHDPLAFHSGGSRLEMEICTNCHNPTGNTRMEVLIHGLHAASDAVPRNAGSTRDPYDFSHVTYPAPISACETCHTGGTPTENFPLAASPAAVLVCDASGLGTTTLNWEYPGYVDIYVANGSQPKTLLTSGGPDSGSVTTGKWVRDGSVFTLYDQATQELVQAVNVNATVLGCVGNAPGAARGVAGAQHTNWMDRTSRVVCGSGCHDVDFTSGEDHIVMNNDDACVFCHEPTGMEFGLSVNGAHQQLVNSSQFPGALVEIVDITDTDPGDTPTVTFSSMTKTGPLDPNGLNRLRFTLTGPNEDFSFYAQETVGTSAIADGSLWKYTFAAMIPADAEGSFTVSVEGRANATVNGETERDLIEDTLMEFAVTDTAAEARRMVVDDALCEDCHVNLSLHGGGRNNANYCVTCHMPEATDLEELQPGAEEQSIHMKYMIHKIHRGEEAVYPYVVAGHNQSVHEYGEVLYPGDLRNCAACHIDDSEQIPLPDGVLATTTPQDWWSPTAPVSAACLSCHDSDDSAAHAWSNTAPFGESCATCHGEGKDAAVDKVHAR